MDSESGAGTSQLRKFLAPEFVFGLGALELAGQYAVNLGATRPLLVTDSGVAEAGWAEAIAKALELSGLPSAVFDAVSPNPRSSEVMTGAALFEEQGCDSLIAVGGGSVIDCAKGIGIVAANGGDILSYEGVDAIAEPMPPTICVPTTGGTSADVSQFAIITHLAERRKVAIISKAVVPDIALIDPKTLTTMDAYLSACTGLDALAHAFEAVASTGASPLTDLHAIEAIRLIARHLVSSIESPKDLAQREAVMLASLHAGLAFSNASLGGVHAMAHSLGGQLDLPHGECNALLLEHVCDFNFADAEPRYRLAAEAMGIAEAADGGEGLRAALLSAIRGLRESVGVAGGLSQRDVESSHIGDLTRNALRDPCLVTNPRRPEPGDIEELYERAL